MTQTYYQIDHPEGNTTGRRIFEKKGYKNGQWITTPAPQTFYPAKHRIRHKL